MRNMYSILLAVVGLLSTTGVSAQWEKRAELPTGSNTRIHYVKQNTLMMWTMGQDILKRSTDGGRTFTNISAYDDLWALGFHDGKMYVVAKPKPLEKTTLYVSTDDGVSFTAVGALPLSENSPYVRSVMSRNGRLVVVSTTKDILLSSDNGANWTKYIIPDSMGVNTSFDIHGDTWALTTNVGTYLSPDNGSTWQKLPRGSNNFAFGAVLFVAGQLYGATYTEVAAWRGSSWEPMKLTIDQPGFYTGARDMQTDGKDLYIVAEGLTRGTGVFRLNGDRFDSVGMASYPPMHLFPRMLTIGDEEIYVAYHLLTGGQGNVYAHPKPGPATSVHDDNIATTTSAAWPNPTTDVVSFSSNPHERVCVVSAYGDVLDLPLHRAGPLASLDMSSLPAGVYVIRSGSRCLNVLKQ